MTKIREATLADHAGIARLELRNGLFSLPESEWRRRWTDNPAFGNPPQTWSIGWVIEADTDPAPEIVGFFGNIPMAYTLNNKRVRAAATHSWVVDDAYRNQAMALLSRFMGQGSVDLLISTTANAATSRAMTALRARPVPQPESDIAQFWITQPYTFARAVAVKRQLPCPGLFGLVAGVAAQIASCLKTGFAGQLSKKHRLSVVTRFDDRFDALWRAQSADSPVLQRLRDRTTLEWHFRRFLEKDQAWIVICEATDGAQAESPAPLSGYALFVRQDNPEIGLTRAVLAEFQALNSDQAVLESLLRAGIAECRKRRLACLESMGHAADKRRVLAALNPFTRKLPTGPYLYKAKNKGLAEQLENPDVWDVCASDGDACL